MYFVHNIGIMPEWELWRQSSTAYETYFNWRFNGELQLDLILRGGHSIPPDFELARFLDHPDLVRSMVSNRIEARMALASIQREGYYIDIIWVGNSPEELEAFFKERYLTPPQGYREAFEQLCSL